MIVFYSAHEGSGCSTVAAATALRASERHRVLLVDLGGETDLLLAARSAPEPAPVGIAEWLAADDPQPDALDWVEQSVAHHVDLLPAGELALSEALQAPQSGDRVQVLLLRLLHDPRLVIVDAGVHWRALPQIVDQARVAALVMRACYVAMAKAHTAPPADHVVLQIDPQNHYRPSDVATFLGTDRLHEVRYNPAVANVINAGLAIDRLGRLHPAVDAIVDAHQRVQHSRAA